MISFSCSHCGLKLKVKPEFAGRSSKCPTCKKPLVVPQPSQTEGHVPVDQIDGTASSVHQAGVDGGVTLGEKDTAGQKSIREMLAKGKAGGQRYVVSEEIARGGMGAVLRAIDCDIRREVAVKYMLDQTDAKKKARFVEEAQITGQLEHPNIVPIHELGVDAKKRLFFSMKMVKGRSLAQVLDELRKNPKTAEKEWTLTRLLNIFVSVCNGMAYAHSRGVINRDCKPANVMVGDFGEVYVMDWGLAKVVSQEAPVASVVAGPASVPTSVSSSGASSKVSTSRDADADLTQEGAIVGTPVYMPPEQAMGDIGEIDQRSDIYSLGAILYEMLTLVPPIEKDGGYLNILMRVSEGDIKAPEVRVPQRASRIPRELSAIAMKALAKKKKDRYQSVEELRKDIERFQEGRSVSAKEDTKREMLVKFVKRNKAFSLTSLAALLVLTVVLFYSFKYNYQERMKAERANKDLVAEKNEKEDRTRKAVPALVGAARMYGESRKPDDALVQLDLALAYDSAYPPAHLLKGQVLIAKREFPNALSELEEYLKLQPRDKEAQELARLCKNARPEDGERLLAFADVLLRQKALGLSDCLMDDVKKLVGSNEKLLPVFRKRIEAAWPGLGGRLTMEKGGSLYLNFYALGDQVRDLTPLKSMPLANLYLGGCGQITDLSPLQGMPLTSLSLSECGQVRDLTPLKSMPLTTLNLYGCGKVQDLTPLNGMPLTSLNLERCTQIKDLTPLKGMPLTSLHLQYCGQVQDLTPLNGMPLTSLNLGRCTQIKDLTPLKGMPLTTLSLAVCGQVQDLTPLQGMPLTTLDLHGCGQVRDLSPLEGMELVLISLYGVKAKGIDVLRRMKSLKHVHYNGNSNTASYTVEDFWKKYDAGELNK